MINTQQLPDTIYPASDTLQLTTGTNEEFINNLKLVVNTLAKSQGLYKTLSVLYLAPENTEFYQTYSSTLLSRPNSEKYTDYLASYSSLMQSAANNDSAKAYIKTTVENIVKLGAEGHAALVHLNNQANAQNQCNLL